MSIVQAINDFKFDPKPESILAFLKERESIRIKKKSGHPGPWTDNPIMDQSKFLNVFREDDAVSQIVNQILVLLKDHEDALYAAVYIARLVNHREHLKWLFTGNVEWLLDAEDMQEKMREFVAKGDTVCNPGAYQINPRIGFKYGHRNIRDSLIHVIPARLFPVTESMASFKEIDKATEAANEAFGGFSNFWMFQACIDISYHRPDLMDPDSAPYFGSGSKNAHEHMETLQVYLNENKPDNWRRFHPYDVENALCEYRKYKMREAKGIPNNRQYKRKLI